MHKLAIYLATSTNTGGPTKTNKILYSLLLHGQIHKRRLSFLHPTKKYPTPLCHIFLFREIRFHPTNLIISHLDSEKKVP